MNKEPKTQQMQSQMTLREEAELAALALRSGSGKEAAEILADLGARYHDTRMPVILRAVEEGRFVDAADLLDLAVLGMK